MPMIIETAARFLEVMPDALTMKLDETQGQCLVYAPAIPEKRMTLGQIAELTRHANYFNVEARSLAACLMNLI